MLQFDKKSKLCPIFVYNEYQRNGFCHQFRPICDAITGSKLLQLMIYVSENENENSLVEICPKLVNELEKV